jgi:hypothetical protein
MTAIQNRPIGKLDAQGRLNQDSFLDEAFRGDYTGTNLIYKGFARPGSATSVAVWQIAKLAYDGANNLISITWPELTTGNVSSDYEFVWDNRASYTYA